MLPTTGISCTWIWFDWRLHSPRTKPGTYPTKLSALAPKYVAQIPLDILAGVEPAELHYQPAKDSYLLYSVGGNGEDNDGKFYDGSEDSSALGRYCRSHDAGGEENRRTDKKRLNREKAEVTEARCFSLSSVHSYSFAFFNKKTAFPPVYVQESPRQGRKVSEKL